MYFLQTTTESIYNEGIVQRVLKKIMEPLVLRAVQKRASPYKIHQRTRMLNISFFFFNFILQRRELCCFPFSYFIYIMWYALAKRQNTFINTYISISCSPFHITANYIVCCKAILRQCDEIGLCSEALKSLC